MAQDEPRETVHTDDHPGDGVSRGTARMEAFADAVFAIAFTLPVVEIHLPKGGALWPQLAEAWPSYLGYGIAAFVIGTYWSHHHFAGAIYRTTGHWFNIATVVFLAAIGFIAFPARAFAENFVHAETRADAAVFLTCALAVTSATWLLKWEVGRATGHVDDRLEPAYVARLGWMYRLTLVAYLAGIALSCAWWPAGLAMCALITLRYLIPPATPAYRTDAPKVEGEA
jgi:uncharacterized membrane protein